MVGHSVIPAAALSQHVIALGKTRSGKSSKLRVLVEHLLDGGEPVCIIDPKGDWWGLKSSASGKASGYPVVIFGGEHADVPLNAHAGAHIAELVATGNRSCLIDLGGWMVGERTRFFIDFASTLFKLTKGKRYLAIDEVHNFCPKGKIFDPDAGKALHWANRLASEGQGKGLVLLAASQRPQKVHNDFLTSCETLIACRVIHKADRDAIKDWIDGCADAATGRDVLASLAQMQRTDAWVWSPEIDFGPERITWPMFATYDSFKPQPADAGKLKGWAEVDLEEVKAKLVTVVKEAEANDPRKLKAEVVRLTKLLDTRTLEVKDDPKTREHIETLTADNAALRVALKTATDAWKQADGRLRKIATLADVQSPEIAAPTPPPAALPRRPPPSAPRPRAATNGHDRSDTALGKGERAVLTAIAQYDDGVDREQITVLTGYKRSTRDAYVQRLQAAGLVDIGPPIRATEAGIAALPADFEPLPIGDELREHWLRRLPQGEAKVLEVLVAAYPNPVARDEITNLTDYKRSTRDAYIQRLGTRKLVNARSDGVTASDILFGV